MFILYQDFEIFNPHAQIAPIQCSTDDRNFITTRVNM